MAEPVWARPAPRPRAPRHTRDEIAAAALAVADTEGIEAVSMRRIASEVGLGTMSLYHYVPTKHDLLMLVGDAIMLELIIPAEVEPAWRTRLTEIARRARKVWQEHPWAISFLRDVRLGPNGMRNLEQWLAAVAEFQMSPTEKLGVINLIEDYVLGFVLHSDLRPPPEDREQWRAAESRFIAEQLETGAFPHSEELFCDPDPETVLRRLEAEANHDQRFELGLRRVLDGIALHLDAAAGQ